MTTTGDLVFISTPPRDEPLPPFAQSLIIIGGWHSQNRSLFSQCSTCLSSAVLLALHQRCREPSARAGRAPPAGPLARVLLILSHPVRGEGGRLARTRAGTAPSPCLCLRRLLSIGGGGVGRRSLFTKKNESDFFSHQKVGGRKQRHTPLFNTAHYTASQ